jgi:hypothetical protein
LGAKDEQSLACSGSAGFAGAGERRGSEEHGDAGYIGEWSGSAHAVAYGERAGATDAVGRG